MWLGKSDNTTLRKSNIKFTKYNDIGIGKSNDTKSGKVI